MNDNTQHDSQKRFPELTEALSTLATTAKKVNERFAPAEHLQQKG